MSELTQQIEKANAAFVEEHKDGGLAQVSKSPSRIVAIRTCMDTRLLDFLEPAMGLKRGEAKIIKVAGNTAGRTFDSVIGSLMVAVYELHVTDIIVVGHEDCGMLHTTAASLCKKMFDAGIAPDIIDDVEPRLMAWADPICDSEESVRVTVRNLQRNPYLPGGIHFHGAVIHPDTGAVRFVITDGEKK